ncbi:cytochrome c oxidase subunit 4 [Desulfuromusa kysingii]|uniref:Cytochrome c oxidase subunit 4 n=1 Tax=Desulfuromusa kysingii TaxID=37625 RepID=A0A1H3W7L6_9BACT|nr:cytochrome C oxidase subunit IV family protein [Desulfuromusa kysingii]SDZ82268.1 cytochrome c oxidase subunit 4 [Desulfuromusa kysingii]
MTEHKHEPVPFRTFILIWFALLVLTVVTVAVSRVHLGAWNIWVALTIASIKSSLVVFIFMHLRQESKLFKIGLLTLLIIVAIFIGLTFTDVLYR